MRSVQEKMFQALHSLLSMNILVSIIFFILIMYRVNTWDDLYSTGFFDYIDNGIIIIEWSENIEEALPADCIKIRISKGENDDDRIFEIEGVDPQ